MKVTVVFEFPEVDDPDSEDADDIIEDLQIDLTNLGYDYYIDDAVGGTYVG